MTEPGKTPESASNTDTYAARSATTVSHIRDLVDQNTDTVVLVPGLDGTAELFYRQIPLLAKFFNVTAFP